MFKSILLLPDYIIPPPADDYLFSFHLIDTEFENIIRADTYWQAIIAEYEKRNLNVASNLAIAYDHMKLLYQTDKECTFYMFKASNGKYDKEIEKYLMLI